MFICLGMAGFEARCAPVCQINYKQAQVGVVVPRLLIIFVYLNWNIRTI